MAVPSTAFTMDGIALKVAEKLGVASYAGETVVPALPYDDPFTLYKVCEYVTRGINLFVDSAPKEGWHWTRRDETVTFDPDGTGDDNIASDASRYLLSADFSGEVAGQIHYVASSNHSTKIEWCDEQRIRELRAGTISTAYPYLAAIKPYQPTSNTASSLRKWEMLVWPAPSSDLSVSFPFLYNFDGCKMYGGVAESASATTVVDSAFSYGFASDDYFNGWYAEIVYGTGKGSYAVITDYTGSTGTFIVADWLDLAGNAGGTDPAEDSGFIIKPAHPYYHPAGVTFDSTIESACLAACEIYGSDQIDDTHHTNVFYQRKIPEAHLKNRRMRPKRLGRMTNGPRTTYGRSWSDVTTGYDI